MDWAGLLLLKCRIASYCERNRKKVNLSISRCRLDFKRPLVAGRYELSRQYENQVHIYSQRHRSDSTAPWVGLGLAEKLKRETLAERAKEEQQTDKSERALAWFRRSR